MSVIKRAEGVYQRGKDPRVLTLVFNGPPKDGKSRNQLSVRFVGSLSDAKIERGRLVAEASSGNSVAQTKMTVGQLVAEWLSLYAEQNLEPNSYQAAEWIARVHINNKDHGIGHIQADELTARQLDRFYKTLRSSGRIDGKGGLGSRSVQHIHDILRQVLRWAVKKGDLRTNIALNADPPKVQQRTVKPMGESRTCELIEATRGTTSYVPVMLAIFTGCRQGEIAALKWCDVDLDEGRISVNRSLQQVPKDFAEKLSSVSGDLRGKLSEMEDGCREKLPKNGKSRAIPICQTLITELRRVKGQQAEVRLAIGSDYNSEGWVCIDHRGNRRTPNAIGSAFLRFTREHGFAVRFHDLRHEFASLLATAGVHPSVAAELLGHSKIDMTHYYTHVQEATKREAVGQLDNLLGARQLTGTDG